MNEELIEALSDGRFHSGRALGAALGVSRAAIWKAVRRLAAEGVSVHSVRGKGYRIPGGVDLLQASRIHSLLPPVVAERLVAIDVFSSVDSTNEVALSRVRTGPVQAAVVLAERQTAGRGRRGRRWVSPFGSNLYLSLIWQFDGGAAAIEGLSLAVGVALCRTLRGLGVRGVGIKWPNDLIVDGKKLGGILIELSGDLSGRCQTVIGVGLNFGMREAAGKEIDQPWTQLSAGELGLAGRNELAAKVIEALMDALDEFGANGINPFLSDWASVDVLKNLSVTVAVGDTTYDGIARGVSTDGGLLLERYDGDVSVFKGGEVTVRKAQ